MDDGGAHYFYDDANGSQRVMTKADGTPDSVADFYPFGEPHWPVGSRADNYIFAGQYTDENGEDAGNSTPHRHYQDDWGRWMTPDSSVDEPVGPGGIKVVNLADPQTWNLYAYVTDNPTTLNDPSGLGAHCTGQNTEHNNVLTCEQAQAAAQLTATLKNSTQERAQQQKLTNAQNAARNNPNLRPTKNGTTFCNIATCQIAKAMGAPMGALTNPKNGQPALANQIAANLAKSGSGYRQVSPQEAQQLANEGKLVIAVQPHFGHGHIATVRPGGSGNDPLINNIGKHMDIRPASRAFYSSPAVEYYTPQ